jgi:hypothetical protein
MRRKNSYNTLFIFPITSLFIGCSEIRSNEFLDIESALDAGMIERGWLPGWLPSDSKNISIEYNIDTGEVTFTFYSDIYINALNNCGVVESYRAPRLGRSRTPNDLGSHNPVFYCDGYFLYSLDQLHYAWRL